MGVLDKAGKAKRDGMSTTRCFFNNSMFFVGEGGVIGMSQSLAFAWSQFHTVLANVGATVGM